MSDVDFFPQIKVKMEDKWMSKLSIQYKFTKTIENNPFLGKQKNHNNLGLLQK
jgi:hypothetical protein